MERDFSHYHHTQTVWGAYTDPLSFRCRTFVNTHFLQVPIPRMRGDILTSCCSVVKLRSGRTSNYHKEEPFLNLVMSQFFNIFPILYNTENPRCFDPAKFIPNTQITLKFILTLFFHLPTWRSKVFLQYFLTKIIYFFLFVLQVLPTLFFSTLRSYVWWAFDFPYCEKIFQGSFSRAKRF
jgi:hypothetical protein